MNPDHSAAPPGTHAVGVFSSVLALGQVVANEAPWYVPILTVLAWGAVSVAGKYLDQSRRIASLEAEVAALHAKETHGQASNLPS